MVEISDKYTRIMELVSSINLATTRISGGRIVFFREISIDIEFNTFEGCFKDMINWLYALYFEVSKPNLDYMVDKIRANHIALSDQAMETKKLIHAIRTVRSHNLDLSKSDDRNKRNYCEEWFKAKIGRSTPVDEGSWRICLSALLDQVLSFLGGIEQGIAISEGNDEFDVALSDWIKKVERSYLPHDFEVVLASVLKNFGIDIFLDTNKIAKREFQVWAKQLDSLQDGFDFHTEASRIVTKFVQKEGYCPVDQKDLIDIGCTPGFHLKEILQQVCAEFYRQPRHKDALLNWVRQSRLVR